jgi:hypothetical protein
LISGDEEYFGQLMELSDGISPENVYQLGLLMVDLMYAAESNQLTSSQTDDFLVRDRPVSRSPTLNSDKSYYHI